MKSRTSFFIGCSILFVSAGVAVGQTRGYRLNSVDLKQPVIWGAECRQPPGGGLAFGGQDQNADDGRPHTRLLVDGQWKAIHQDLRSRNPLQTLRHRTWTSRQSIKNIVARTRFVYFEGGTKADNDPLIESLVRRPLQKAIPDLLAIEASLGEFTSSDEYYNSQAKFAENRVRTARERLASKFVEIDPDLLKRWSRAQIDLEIASESLDAEPPPRAMNCGTARLPQGKEGPPGETLVFDPETELYLLFGGDHLDYLTNDTWVFDSKSKRWFHRHPKSAPPPRANHRLNVESDGRVRLVGGYAYSSNTDYIGGQYADLNDGEWTYDMKSNVWTGTGLTAPDSRVYRTGPFHPDFYLEGEAPNAQKFESWLGAIPANTWTPTNPPHLPRLNRDWGTARIDSGRDMMLRWSGGHSAHGGSDVLHYHFAANRWELPFPVEFPLGQLYSNTSYPNGYNFNLRPWMTGHTYQNYDYDPPSRTMIKAGRPQRFYVYDPNVGDWVGRGEKPTAMQYNSCFYTLTLTATPHGVICWDKNGRVHRYDHQRDSKVGKWVELELTGERLPGAYVDNSSIAYDSKRNRVLIVNTLGYGKSFDGRVWSVDLNSNKVASLSPLGRESAKQFSNIDKCCYDAQHDLLILGAYIKDAGGRTPTPAYDCGNNRWVGLGLKYSTGTRSGSVTRDFPHLRSDGLMFDAKRNLLWGTNTNSQVYVLRLDMETLDVDPLD